MRLLLLFVLTYSAVAQYTSQTYPNPLLDPLACRLPFSSQVCDPSAVLSDDDRIRLMQRINQFRPVTSGIRNTSPACALQPDKNLDIFLIVIDKIGSIPGAPADIEKFANNLKRRFQNYQDVSSCDTMVLIVNSKQDRQVFTVAGRDARISKETLKLAFERNVGHFKSGNYAMGLEGMIEMVVAAYSNAHIVQVPTPGGFNPLPIEPAVPAKVPSAEIPAPESVAPFRAAGLPNTVNAQRSKALQVIRDDEIDEKDKVWVAIMQQAVSRCGSEHPENIPNHVRAIVEEAMSISLKLISDSRYNSIEEEVETHKDVLGTRERNLIDFPMFLYRTCLCSSQEAFCNAF
ncbi:unnamed protein product [Nippostrongylus brasiliensis]|uniref:VWFA domain-containing protein n=1 Tax=Nippostrongylus brasiliensis TaxID=27835 RepID=A0A0N4XCV3_NIPBR|nr:unnamed protein product [Nippostrongylus brasiliensis]